jgi:uncharacterized protein YfaS (alpha-2-macroglobulin family)
VTADIKVNGKQVGKLSGNDLKLNAKQLGGNIIDIATKGEGRLYYYWVAEGVSATGAYKEEDNYLKVRRQFYTRSGQLITGNRFRQNDLVIVKITLEKSFATPVENVVITDIYYLQGLKLRIREQRRSQEWIGSKTPRIQRRLMFATTGYIYL